MVAGTIRDVLSSPCASQDELDAPPSPPRTLIEKEGVEVVMPMSPTSVFVLVDDDQIQHVKPVVHDESCFYMSDASETASIALSVGSRSLLGASFLIEETSNYTKQETAFPSIPRMIMPKSLKGGIGNSKRTDSDFYIYSDDDEDEEEEEVDDQLEQEAELLGLRCLPEVMMCAPFSGLLDDDTWESLWGSSINLAGTSSARTA